MLMLASVCALVLATQGQAEDKDTKNTKGDASKMVGTWTVTSVETDAKKATADTIKGKEVKVTRDTITCNDKNGKSEMTCSYTVDTSATPWKLEMSCTEGEHKGKKLKGIARLDGDKLNICFAKPDSDAPTKFETKEGQCCLTLERSSR